MSILKPTPQYSNKYYAQYGHSLSLATLRLEATQWPTSYCAVGASECAQREILVIQCRFVSFLYEWVASYIFVIISKAIPYWLSIWQPVIEFRLNTCLMLNICYFLFGLQWFYNSYVSTFCVHYFFVLIFAICVAGILIYRLVGPSRLTQ